MQETLGKNAASTTDFLKTIGAPDSQISQVQGQIAPAGAHDTLYALRGVIPATSLTEEGAAWTAAAQQLPYLAHAQGLQQIGTIQQKQREQDAAFASDIAKVAAQAPELYARIKKDIADQNYRDAELKMRQIGLNQSAARLRLAYQNQQFQQGMAVTKYRTSVSEFNARQSLAITKAQWAQANADRTYGLSYQKFVNAEARAAKAAKTGGLTPYQVTQLHAKAEKELETFYSGVAPVTRADGSISKAGVKPLTYQQAIRRLVNRYPTLGPSAVINLANSLYKPGEGGRPIKPEAMISVPPTGSLGVQASAPLAAGGRGSVVATATSVLGTPYSWGGGGPGGPSKGTGRGANTVGFDCSGFVQYVFAQHGVHLPRTTYAQVKYGQAVNLNQLQPGDVIFTEPGPNGPNHVGIYVGGGVVVESPHTGSVNQKISLQSFLGGGFVAARRYISG